MGKEEILTKAYDALLDLDEETSEEVLNEAVEAGVDLKEVLQRLSQGMSELGEQFTSGEIFIPELMIAASIMQTATDKLNELMPEGSAEAKKKGKIVFATVHGDVHDIGKAICCSLLKTCGVEVIDLGRDVPAEEIIQRAEDENADIIAMSSLLTTSMVQQQVVCDKLKEMGIRDKYYVMVGGAPVTQRWAEKIGADIYTEDATECVKAVSAYVTSL